MTDLVPADFASAATPARRALTAPTPLPTRRFRQLVEESGLTRVHLLAWRDLADPEAGGSEVHADKVAQAWAGAGLDVTLRTAAAAGPARVRQAQRLLRRAQGRPLHRLSRAPRCPARSAAPARATGWSRSGTACRSSPRSGHACPRIVFLHHVHAEMWRMVLPPKLAKIGETIEFQRRAAVLPPHPDRHAVRVQPRRDRRAARSCPPQNVTVVPPGIDPMYSPGAAARSPHPLVVAVGRLVPVKRPAELDLRAARDQEVGPRRSKPSSSARATSGTPSRRRSGPPAPQRLAAPARAGSATTSWSSSTGAPGC